MTPAQRERVKELLIEALEHAAEERTEVLDTLCANDSPTIRVELERLLALREEMGGFLEKPAITLSADARPGGSVGVTLNGRFVLEAHLGRGGFGDVYKAEDALLGRSVAVKLLHPGVLSETTLRHELKALASLDHPGIVGVLDAGVAEDGRYFLVLRYVEGPTLREVLSAKTPLGPSFVKRITEQLVEALVAAHRLGVLHLDLKPENIVIRDHGKPDEQAVVLDFGVGALLSGFQFQLLTGRTSPYQAPELARGDQSHHSDLYSLGAVIFEMLTARRFENQASLADVPRLWRGLLTRLLDDAPPRRFGTASELQSAVRRIGSRAWIPVTASALGLFLLAVILLWSRRPPERYIPPPIPFTTLQGEESFPRFSADGKRVYFSWSRDDAKADIYVKDLAGGDPVQLTSHPANEINATGSPDGKLIAFLRDRGGGRSALIVMSATGGQETEVAEAVFDSISWSPDQNVLAVAVSDTPEELSDLRLLNLGTREWTKLKTPSGIPLGGKHPAFSSDGRKLTFVRKPERGRTYVYSVLLDEHFRPKAEARLLTPAYADAWRPHWTPDGKTIAYAGGPGANRTLWSVPGDGSGPPRPIPEAGDQIASLAVSQREHRIVYAFHRSDSNIWLLDLDANHRLVQSKPIVASTREDEEQQLSPDGTKLAFVSHRSGSEQIWLAETSGGGERQLTQFSESDNLQVYWSPDGKQLLISGVFRLRRHSYLLSLPGGKLAEIGRGLDEIASGWSRDGKWIYFNSTSPKRPGVCRIRTHGGEPVHVTEAPAVRVVESFDGKTLFYCTRRYSEGVWSMPISGGAGTKIIPSFTRRAFAVARDGLYYVSDQNPPALRYRAFANHTDVEVFRLKKKPWFGLDVTADGHTVFFTQIDHNSVDLMLIDGFRL